MACLLPTAEPSYPKPNISGIPSRGVSVGEAMAIWCRRQRQGVRFVLNKEGRHFPPVDSDGFGAVFPISNVSREDDAGSYSCYYHDKRYQFTWSYPSDPVELVVAGQEFLKPTIWVSPIRVVALGGNVTIRCEGQDLGMEFVLRKAGHPNPQVWTMLPDGTGAELLIPGVGREDGGSYTCNYRSTMEPSRSSYPSDPVEIIVGGEGPGSTSPLPDAQTDGTPAQGVGTMWVAGIIVQRKLCLPCLEPLPRDTGLWLASWPGPGAGRPGAGVRGLGDPWPQGPISGDTQSFWGLGAAQLALPTPLEAQHSMGSCAGWGPVAGSPCRPLPAQGLRLTTCLLLLPEPTLPNPSFHPSREVSLGGSVSVRCQGLHPGVRFVLNKGGRHVAHVDTERLEFVFPINNVQREQGGNYSCSHHSRSEPFTEWSDPVELVVRGEGPGLASPFPAPPPARPSRGSQSESGLSVLVPPGLIRPRLAPSSSSFSCPSSATGKPKEVSAPPSGEGLNPLLSQAGKGSRLGWETGKETQRVGQGPSRGASLLAVRAGPKAPGQH
uniref:Ig-like domain-containing protein n=1 Tax=Gopherus evgoodei TaxID=1825980 RepID=A0A8C4WIB8_9SAUR